MKANKSKEIIAAQPSGAAFNVNMPRFRTCSCRSICQKCHHYALGCEIEVKESPTHIKIQYFYHTRPSLTYAGMDILEHR